MLRCEAHLQSTDLPEEPQPVQARLSPTIDRFCRVPLETDELSNERADDEEKDEACALPTESDESSREGEAALTATPGAAVQDKVRQPLYQRFCLVDPAPVEGGAWSEDGRVHTDNKEATLASVVAGLTLESSSTSCRDCSGLPGPAPRAPMDAGMLRSLPGPLRKRGPPLQVAGVAAGCRHGSMSPTGDAEIRVEPGELAGIEFYKAAASTHTLRLAIEGAIKAEVERFGLAGAEPRRPATSA